MKKKKDVSEHSKKYRKEAEMKDSDLVLFCKFGDHGKIIYDAENKEYAITGTCTYPHFYGEVIIQNESKFEKDMCSCGCGNFHLIPSCCDEAGFVEVIINPEIEEFFLLCVRCGKRVKNVVLENEDDTIEMKCSSCGKVGRD